MGFALIQIQERGKLGEDKDEIRLITSWYIYSWVLITRAFIILLHQLVYMFENFHNTKVKVKPISQF